MMDTSTSKMAFDDALDSLGIAEGRERGMYAPLVRRYPIRTGDAIPPAVKRGLDENETCACTNSSVVYVDLENARKMFARARKVAAEASKSTDLKVDYPRAKENYETLLVHEYTHIIMKHVEKGIKFVRANGYDNYPIFALACDIEANRGWGINSYCDLYKIGVTDDYYPECKGINGLMNIYRALKKNYGNEILKDYEEATDGDGADGDGDGSDDGSESEKDSSADSDEEQKAQKRKNAIKQAVDSMEKMKEEIEQRSSTMTDEELNEDASQYDENEPKETGAGLGVGESGGSAFTPRKELEKHYDAYVKRETEKAMDKLKGLVRGSMIRDRVKTYSRQSRKDSADGLIRKGVKNKKELAPRILVAMDSSGSMRSSAVTPVATSIGTIAKMLGKTKGSYICEHDGKVKNVEPLSKWEKVVKGYYPQGDNDFDAVLQKAIELDVEVVINVGDGYEYLYDRELMKQAKKKGIKWVDVQVCGLLDELEGIIARDKEQHGDNFIGREIIKVNN